MSTDLEIEKTYRRIKTLQSISMSVNLASIILALGTIYTILYPQSSFEAASTSRSIQTALERANCKTFSSVDDVISAYYDPNMANHLEKSLGRPDNVKFYGDQYLNFMANDGARRTDIGTAATAIEVANRHSPITRRKQITILTNAFENQSVRLGELAKEEFNQKDFTQAALTTGDMVCSKIRAMTLGTTV